MARARVLHLDDDEQMLQLVTDSFAKEEIAVVSAARPIEALDLVRQGRFDLIISDVNLPQMNGFQFRNEVRGQPGYERTPFLFVSGADPTVEVEIAKEIGEDRLLIKPFPRSDLRRAVFAMLHLLRTDSGPLPDSLDRILSAIAENAETGVLTTVSGPLMKRIVFQDGRLAFAASNDPKDLIGQALVRAGLISEADLVAAISARETLAGPGGARLNLGAALAVLRKVTPEQCEKVFEDKVREALLDVFLWTTGSADYVAGGVEAADRPYPISLELQGIRREGMIRRGRWVDVTKTLPDVNVRFEVVKWPALFPRTDSDRVLARHVETGRSIAEILVELRGQTYAVGNSLAELVKAGALKPKTSEGFSGSVVHDTASIMIDQAITDIVDEPGEVTAKFKAATKKAEDTGDLPAVKEDPGKLPSRADLPVSAVLTRALTLFREGNLAAARIGFLDVLAIDPADPLARMRLKEVDEAIAAAARKGGLTDEVRVRLAIPIATLAGRQIPPNDAFVLTRLSGTSLSIADLVGLCPIPEHEVLAAVEKYLADGTLERA